MNEITYFIPYYAENIGSITKVAWENGEEAVLNISCRAYLRKLCRQYAVDSIYSRDKYGRLLGCVNCVPLPLTASLLLMPLKVRRPILKSDGAMGYINFHQVTHCREGDNGTNYMVFKNGKELEILSRMKTIRRAMNDAALVNDHYRKEKGIPDYSDMMAEAAKAMVCELMKSFCISEWMKNNLK